MARMRASLILTAVSLALAVGSVARASVVRVDFGGVVDSLDVAENSSSLEALIGGSITPGTRFSGHVIFDAATPPAFPEMPGDFLMPSPASVLNLSLGAFDASGGRVYSEVGPPGFELWVATSGFGGNDASDLQVRAFLDPFTGPEAGSLTFWSFELDLQGSGPGDPLASNDPGLVAWDLALFPTHTVAWSFVRPFGPEENENVVVHGTLDTLSSTAVAAPEPAAGALAALLATAADGILGYRRARS